MAWNGGKLITAEIEAFSDGAIKVRSASFNNSTVRVDGSAVAVQNGTVTIAATKGRKYLVTVN
jgi:hypothetical protein